MTDTYSLKKRKTYTLKLRELLKELPPFCAEFFRGIEDTTTALTRYGYAIDLRIFFEFLIRETDAFSYASIRELTLNDLDRVTVLNIECFMEFISYYKTRDDKEIVNGERAKARKLSTLRSFYKYFYRKEKIHNNPPSLVVLPKLHDKSIIRLDPNEIADLLDMAEDGDGLSDRQKKYHIKTRTRDVAILTLFLGTGIRISELVGINLEDVNFVSNEFSIIRKGEKQDILAINAEIRKALLDYLLEREAMHPVPGHENAFFLSLQRKRITVRAVENLVKKYAQVATPLKKITPHKLRSTYGTMLYRETGDIYLVADVLGHKDVNTTRKHYAAISEDRRRLAAQVIKLREDD